MTGSQKLSASGTAGRNVRGDGKITAGRGERGGSRNGGVAATTTPQGELDLSVRPPMLPHAPRRMAPARLSVRNQDRWPADTIRFATLRQSCGGIGGDRGQISLAIGKHDRLDGRNCRETTRRCPTVITSVIGIARSQAAPAERNAQWSIEPYAIRAVAGFEKDSIYAVRATIAPGTVAQQVRACAVLSRQGIELEEREEILADEALA